MKRYEFKGAMAVAVIAGVSAFAPVALGAGEPDAIVAEGLREFAFAHPRHTGLTGPGSTPSARGRSGILSIGSCTTRSNVGPTLLLLHQCSPPWTFRPP
jgi:hypothetical protein